jgi:hypothetical protein
MTRRGTLAYYLAAWVIVCFIVTALLSVEDTRTGIASRAADFLALYFLALIVGAGDALIFAFALRRLMHWLDTRSLWAWLLAGASISLALILAIAWSAGKFHLPEKASSGSATLAFIWNFFGIAAWALSSETLWKVPIGGALGGLVLCLIDRAFNRPGEESNTAKVPAV